MKEAVSFRGDVEDGDPGKEEGGDNGRTTEWEGRKTAVRAIVSGKISRQTLSHFVLSSTVCLFVSG